MVFQVIFTSEALLTVRTHVLLLSLMYQLVAYQLKLGRKRLFTILRRTSEELVGRKCMNSMVDLVYGSVVVETTCDILGRFRCTLCEHFYATSDVKTKLASMENFTSHVM